MAEAAGVTSEGNFEQRRSGWSNGEKKASCFECGSTDHFKALRPIWITKRRKIAGSPAASRNQNEMVKEKKKERNVNPNLRILHAYGRNQMKKIMKNKK